MKIYEKTEKEFGNLKVDHVRPFYILITIGICEKIVPVELKKRNS